MTRTEAAHAITLVGEPRDVLLARAFVRRTLAERGLQDFADDAVAVISELVTNSIMHGRGPITAKVGVDEGEIEVSVSDTAPTVPAPRDPDVEDEGGRGLLIVAKLSDRWWTEAGPYGKTTIARISLRRR